MRRYKKPTIQLTSLLDLLFMMIFISMMQTKHVAVEAQVERIVEAEVKSEPKINPISQVTAIFHFFPLQTNSRAQVGTYAMSGTFDSEKGTLALGGVSWINRPEGYDMIPLMGTIEASKMQFTGRVDFPHCEVFTLRRTSSAGTTQVSGKWEGSYVCSQGETGLTLTIQ